MRKLNKMICIIIIIFFAYSPFTTVAADSGKNDLNEKLRFLAYESGFHALEKPKKESHELFELGRMLFFDKILYKFRTPPLRNVFVTGPYMHDGAYRNLEDAMKHVLNPSKSFLDYNESKIIHEDFLGTLDIYPARNKRRLEQLDSILIKGIFLTEPEYHDLMDFLSEALTDPAVYRMESIVPQKVPSNLPIED